jgi:hypothetical protein
MELIQSLKEVASKRLAEILLSLVWSALLAIGVRQISCCRAKLRVNWTLRHRANIAMASPNIISTVRIYRLPRLPAVAIRRDDRRLVSAENGAVLLYEVQS